MITKVELAEASALDLAGMVAQRVVSSRELVEFFLARIEAVDNHLGAFVTMDADGALTAADALDRDKATAERPFCGVPIAIKDNTETRGLRTTFSSRRFRDYVPDFDTGVVRRLKAAGFVVLGKTNTPEFGTLPVTESTLNGPTRNPWNTDLTAGGSSGGSAAAVAAGLVPIAHGTDGGGSIRIPASCCGVIGLKPSRFRISWAPRSGSLGGLLAIAVPAMVGRTVDDVSAALDVLAGPEPNEAHTRPWVGEADKTSSVGPLRIAVTSTAPNGEHVDADCLAAVDAAAALLSDFGHRVIEEAPNWSDPAVGPAFKTVLQTVLEIYGASESDELEPLNKWLFDDAKAASSLELVRAFGALEAHASAVLPLWERVDVLVTPTLAKKPVPIGWVTEPAEPLEQLIRAGAFSPFARVANITGQPALSLPLHWASDGVPVGIQLIGPPNGEALLLALARQLEEAEPLAGHRAPPLDRWS